MTMDSTRQKVASGRFDQACLDEMTALARNVVSGRRGPTGSTYWNDDDIDDLVQETIIRVTTGRMVSAAAQATRDQSFKRWLKNAMHDTLAAQARRSPSGRLLRAIDDALSEEPGVFRVEDGCWRLVSDKRTQPWHGHLADLVKASWTVKTRLVRLSSTADKTPPLASREDMRAVCAAVLAVSGPIRKRDLIDVIARRFNAMHEALFDYHDLSTASDDPPDPSSTGLAEDTVNNMMLARWMREQLTKEERKVLEAVRSGAGVRDVGEILGCGKDKAATIKRRVEAKIRLWADESPEGEQAAVETLLELCATEQ